MVVEQVLYGSMQFLVVIDVLCIYLFILGTNVKLLWLLRK